MKENRTAVIETAANLEVEAIRTPDTKATVLDIGSLTKRIAGLIASLNPDYKLAYLSGVADGLSMGEIEAEHDDSTDKTAS